MTSDISSIMNQTNTLFAFCLELIQEKKGRVNKLSNTIALWFLLLPWLVVTWPVDTALIINFSNKKHIFPKLLQSAEGNIHNWKSSKNFMIFFEKLLREDFDRVTVVH